MTDPIILTTYDWVPEGPRGHVRDVRIRWALEEAGLDYEVATTPFYDRGATHSQRQPFGQVPFLEDNGVKLFESGAILLHLGRKSEKLMPRDAQGEAETLEWVVASLNSMEMVTVPWWFLRVSGDPDNGLAGWMNQRFEKLESVLAERDWLSPSSAPMSNGSLPGRPSRKPSRINSPISQAPIGLAHNRLTAAVPAWPDQFRPRSTLGKEKRGVLEHPPIISTSVHGSLPISAKFP